MKKGKFFGVGLGPGDPGLVTLRAAEILRCVDRIYAVASRQTGRSVSGGIVRALGGVSAPLEELEFVMADDPAARRRRIGEHAARIGVALDAGCSAAFVTIGDPMTYGCCSYLLAALRERCAGLDWEIVPGVNSWSALAARAGVPLAEDREILRIVPDFAPGENVGQTTIHLKTYRSRNEVLAAIPAGHRVLYGEELGLERAFLSEDRTEIAGRPTCYLSILMEKEER